VTAASAKEGALRRLSSGRAGELGVLATLACWSLIPLALLLHYSSGTLIGVDGPIPADQLQYLAWARSAGGHILSANDFDLLPRTYVFLHPLFLSVGLLWRAGIDLAVAYLLFKPLAVAALFAGYLAYVRRLLASDPPARRLAALVIALGTYGPLVAVVQWTGVWSAATRGKLQNVASEAFSAAQLWGNLPTALAIGLMPAFLLCVDALLDPERRRPGHGVTWYAGWATAAGATVAWLHPWQGETLIVIVVALVLWTRSWRLIPRLVIPLAGAAAPVLYYLVLSRVDDAWHTAAATNRLSHFPLWVLLVAFGPLAAAALAGVRGRPADVQERMLRLWPLATLAVYFITPSVPAHVLEGVSLPLAILAVRGWSRMRAPAIAGAAAVAVLVVPGIAVVVRDMRRIVLRADQPFALSRGESDALDYVASARAPHGGVLAPFFIAAAIPARTGRQVWMGHLSWTPDFARRAAAAEALFTGGLRPERAQQLVRSTGARILVSDCRHRADLRPILGPVLASAKRFGCAAVYEVRPVSR
jgi:hypothetical protein